MELVVTPRKLDLERIRQLRDTAHAKGKVLSVDGDPELYLQDEMSIQLDNWLFGGVFNLTPDNHVFNFLCKKRPLPTEELFGEVEVV